MTLEKQFTLEAVEKPKATNPVHQRRAKFLTAIDKQVAKLEAGTPGTTQGRAGWVWQSEKGEWFVSTPPNRRRSSSIHGSNSAIVSDRIRP